MSKISLHTTTLIGRDALLTSLHSTLNHEKTVVISGSGGIGKTTFARRYRDTYSSQYTNVLWMNARTRDLLMADGVDISRQLGLPLWKQYALPLMIQPLRDWLTTNDDYLLIFDGADHSAMIKEISPTQLAGRVIITTSVHSETGDVTTLELPPLAARDGASLVLYHAAIIPQAENPERAGEQAFRAAEELSHTLHGLPLALELAGAYIGATRCSVREYLDAFLACAVDFQDIKAGTDMTVMRVCKLVNAYLVQSHPLSLTTLRRLAFMAPSVIPAQLSMSTKLQQAGEDTTPLAVLEALHLVTQHPDNSTLEIHPSLQAGVRNNLTLQDQQICLPEAMSALHRHLPPEDDVFSGANLRYLAHIKRLADAGEQWIFISPEVAEVFAWAAMVTANREEHLEADNFLNRALIIWKTTLGEMHPVVIEATHRLATQYMQAEKYGQAEELWHQVIHARSRMPDTDRTVLIRCLKDLGVTYAAQDKPENAEFTYRQALSFCDQTIGKEHPLALEIDYQLALLYQITGRYAESASLFAYIHTLYEKTLGRDHAETLNALHAQSSVLIQLGRESEAESLLRKLLLAYERTQRKRSTASIACLFQLWQLGNLHGKTDHTKKISHQIISIFEDLISAPDDPETFAQICGLAGTYMQMQRIDEAEKLWARAFAICERMPELGFAAMNLVLQSLAAVYAQQGRKQSAIVALKYGLMLLNGLHMPEGEEKASLRAGYQGMITALQAAS